MHLILAVMPHPERGFNEAARVLKSSAIAIFDKFLRDEEQPSDARQLLSLTTGALF